MTAPASLPMPVIVDRLRSAGCVFAEDEARLLISTARSPSELAAMVERRAGGQPLEYILGWAEFRGLRIAVEPGVFVPRRRSEFLATQAIALARAATASLTTGSTDAALPRSRTIVVELCCGSGAVAAALAATVDRIEVYAADIDPAAVRCARRNLPGAQVYQGDLFDPLPSTVQGCIDVLIANAPYVPTEAIQLMPPEARDYEAHVALDGGIDGLDVLWRIITDATGWLAPAGSLLVETSEDQAPQVAAAMSLSGLLPRVSTYDDVDATVVIGTRAAAKTGHLNARPGRSLVAAKAG